MNSNVLCHAESLYRTIHDEIIVRLSKSSAAEAVLVLPLTTSMQAYAHTSSKILTLTVRLIFIATAV